MKRSVTFLLASALLFSLQGIAQVKFPQPSPTQTIKQDFGLGSIELTYSRPAAKGRRVFGDLVPYGKIWRTGANTATKIVFSDPVEIGGKKIDTGSYAIYTIPGEEEWEVVLNRGTSNWGTGGYKESDDVVRFKLAPVKLKEKQESFTMQFADVKPESCTLQLMWENRGLNIPITANIKEKIRSQIEAAMATDKKPYFQAAQFYYEYDKNLNKAFDNISKAGEENPKAYWIFVYKARIQKDMGDFTGAKESAKTSMALAKEAKNDDYVRMNEKLLKELK